VQPHSGFSGHILFWFIHWSVGFCISLFFSPARCASRDLVDLVDFLSPSDCKRF
jgi:hypothetical protein